MPLEPFFSGPGLDRADACRSDPAALEALAQRSTARQLRWADGLPALGSDGRLDWTEVTRPELFLGLDGDEPRYSAIVEVTATARTAFPLLSQVNAVEAPILAAAISLARWHRHHRFCANCGHSSELIRGGWSRRCPNCSAEHYPRVDPVVIMLAERDGRVLLGRQPQFPAGRYSALAGFVEVGETLEAAVARELFEEAGIRVADVRYVASQPWPFPSSLMLGCHATAEDHVLRVDQNELEDARWFSREEIEAALLGRADASFEPPPRTAIARTLLERWVAA